MRPTFRILLAITGFWGVGLVLLLVAPVLVDRNLMVPLRTPLAFPKDMPFRAEFTPRYDRLHHVCLEFGRTDTPLTLESRDQYWLDPAKRTNRIIDPTWRVFQNGQLVGTGSWRSNQLQAQVRNALAIGAFLAEAGKEYRVEISPGPNPQILLQAAPVLEVRVADAAKAQGLMVFPAFFQGIGYLLLIAGVVAALVNFRRSADQPC
jgi:hypothetical protein